MLDHLPAATIILPSSLGLSFLICQRKCFLGAKRLRSDGAWRTRGEVGRDFQLLAFPGERDAPAHTWELVLDP